MSRIGKKPVVIPAGVKVALNGGQISVEGPKGKLSAKLHPNIKVAIKDNQVTVTRSSDEKPDRALHGLIRSTIQNMVQGVVQEYTKELQIEGVGFKAQVQGKTLQLSLGFSHPSNFSIPDGVKVETPKPTQVVVKGPDRALVGQTASNIRRYFEPEPYKGKGVRYLGEQVRKKQGKAAA